MITPEVGDGRPGYDGVDQGKKALDSIKKKVLGLINAWISNTNWRNESYFLLSMSLLGFVVSRQTVMWINMHCPFRRTWAVLYFYALAPENVAAISKV